MGFEIYEERMVVRDGKVEDRLPGTHYALVYNHHGIIELRNQGTEPETLRVEIKQEAEDGGAEVELGHLNAAVAALRRLRGADAPATPEVESVRERAATVVERACETLESLGTEVGKMQAGEVRATMLQLIDLATSRGEATPELQSAD